MSRYKTVMADPPWFERGGGKIKRGADKHYPLMKTKDIMAMDVKQFAHPDGAHLWMWATNNHMRDAFQVLDAWGAKYITMITWEKTGHLGMGQYVRGVTEHLLFCRWGKVPYKLSFDKIEGELPPWLMRRKDGRHQMKSLIPAPVGRHSEKPQVFREAVEWMSHGPRLELFSRDKREGWDVWGDDVDNDVVLHTPNRPIVDSINEYDPSLLRDLF